MTDKRTLDFINYMGDLSFVKSFSETKHNLLMWAHYAASYAGMCVEYDFSKIAQSIQGHIYPVVYSDKRLLSAKLEYAIDELQMMKKENETGDYINEKVFIKDIMALFLVKPICWEYEYEWRIVATYPHLNNYAEDLDDENETLYQLEGQSISVKGCIKAVYLGPKMPFEKKKHIREICENIGINVYQMRLSEEYELEGCK